MMSIMFQYIGISVGNKSTVIIFPSTSGVSLIALAIQIAEKPLAVPVSNIRILLSCFFFYNYVNNFLKLNIKFFHGYN